MKEKNKKPTHQSMGQQATGFTVVLMLLVLGALAVMYMQRLLPASQARLDETAVASGTVAAEKKRGHTAAMYVNALAHSLDGHEGYRLSDARFKINVHGLEDRKVSQRMGQIRARSFEYRQDGPARHLGSGPGIRYGFIAQELEEVFPELVVEMTQVVPVGEVPEGDLEGAEAEPQMVEMAFKTVDYTALIPLLVQAMQEQQAQIAAQQERIAALEDVVRGGGPSRSQAAMGN